MTPTLGGPINETFFYEEYNPIVQAALASSPDAYVIIDVVRSDDIIRISLIRRAYNVTAQLRTLERRHHRPGWPHERPVRELLEPRRDAVREPVPRHRKPLLPQATPSNSPRFFAAPSSA